MTNTSPAVSPARVGGKMAIACRWVAGVVLLAGTGGASAADSLFDEKVKPLLATHCVECHGGAKTKSGLDLTTRERTLKGAESGPVVVAGKPDESLLVHLIGEKGDPHMPPKGQLSEAETRVIRTWIEGLSEPPTVAAGKPAKSDHWAFQKPSTPKPPEGREWGRNGIDSFILARLDKAGLRPSAEADRATLVRRATFDLTGLPPTPEEVKAFVEDPSPDAYERVIDRLLASPGYGERWGRHWLDLARYADSGGFHNDLDRPSAWRYRDYVIKSFNADKPYGQFVREQLAGDEVDPTSADALTATGFGRNGPSNDDNVGKTALDREKYRLDELDDVISTTSAVFLGLTLGCARCHDHKYDPFPQADYYRFLAVFNSTVKKEIPLDADGRLAGITKQPKTKSTLMALVEDGPKARPTRLLWRGDVKNEGPAVEPGVPVMFSAVAPARFAAPASGAKTTGQRLALADWIAAPENPLTWRVLANRVWQYHFGRGIVASASNFGISGDRPTHPELLDWLASELVANGGKIKLLHRLIMTSATYRQSSRSNTEAAAVDPDVTLLWRMPKRRLEGEAVRDAVLAVAGTLNPKMGGPGIKPKLPAEMLVASQRNKWPAVTKEGPEHWRRSVYVYVKRQMLFPMLELFDAPGASQTCDRRPVSTLPTQALVLMNDEFMNDQAGRFADRLLREAGAGAPPAALAERALWLALGRAPAEGRVADAVRVMAAQSAAYRAAGKPAIDADRDALIDLCHVLLNTNEYLYVE
ncbi:MAG: PSD1 and planctomycete cytochrome C domain-containing protein [Phycisphaerae bacterium]